MPTATATATSPTSVISLKASQSLHAHSSSSSSSTAATLRSLYPRAARAFLQRDVPLTHSLISSATSLLTPPASTVSLNDSLASQRRKWDILRITFETTLYASPPSSQSPESLSSALRANLLLSPESLMTTLYSRSLQLFTPLNAAHAPSSAFLPSQILITLVLSSLKLDGADVARRMIEDWLSKHGQVDGTTDPGGYAKVLELYCLHVLPRLHDWDYAEDFLTYERELSPDVRQQYTISLRQLRAEAAANATAAATISALPPESLPSSSATSRATSPAPSDSSASSSSTHTAKPRQNGKANANGNAGSLTPLTSSQSPTPKPRDAENHANGRHSPHSTSSQSIASTATSRTVTPQSASRVVRTKKSTRTTHLPNSSPAARSRSRSATPAAATPAARSSSASASSSSIPNSVIRRASFDDPSTTGTSRAPSALALVRASMRSVLRGASRAKVIAYVVLFVLLPLVSFVLRLRRRRAVQTSAGGGAVDAVRRRLRGTGTDGPGGVGGIALVGKVWEELARAVLDTVKMAGRGLV